MEQFQEFLSWRKYHSSWIKVLVMGWMQSGVGYYPYGGGMGMYKVCEFCFCGT